MAGSSARGQGVDVVGRVAGALTAAGVDGASRLLLAVSGGVDSMVLLHVLVRLRERLGFRLQVAHVHHGLRGAAADRDAAFVAAAAERAGLACRVIRLDPDTRGRGVSVQVWAREARYGGLEELRRRLRASLLLTAHTRNDQAETLLLNLLRGSGPRGLGGIPPARGALLRPLLAVDRPAVVRYAIRHGVAFREDASNRSEQYRRNRVRRRLLPLLCREYNPRLVESLAELADRLREDEAALSRRAAAAFRRLVRQDGAATGVPAGALEALEPALARRVLRLLFQRAAGGERDLTRRHLAALARLTAVPGEVRLPAGQVGRRVGDRIVVGKAPPPAAPPPAASGRIGLPAGVWVDWPLLAWRVRVRRIRGSASPPTPEAIWTARLDGDLLEEALALRVWRPGDRFRPAGAPGRKKLQDFFVDAKIPREVRGRLPLLLAGEAIAGVVGHRVAEEFRWVGRGAVCLVEVSALEG